MTIFLRTDLASQMNQALIEAGILVQDYSGDIVAADGYAYDLIGRIYKPTGQTEIVDVGGIPSEEPIMAMSPGWHVNILGDLTDEQRNILPILDPPPVTPYRVFATR